MTPEDLRSAADWLGARLKATPRPVKVTAPSPIKELPLFVATPAKPLVTPSTPEVTQRGGG